MSVWASYPENYRSKEVQAILRACRAGECVSVVGLSGSGKSNLLGFLANRWPLAGEEDDLDIILIDCNRLDRNEPQDVLNAVTAALSGKETGEQLNEVVSSYLSGHQKVLCLLFDRFEIFQETGSTILFNQLRALRDAFKYKLVYLLASRQALSDDNELAELFYAHRLWLGPMSKSDSEWNVSRYAERIGDDWEGETTDFLIELSGGYPSMLRGMCEAFADLGILDRDQLLSHPAIRRRVREFWRDQPDELTLEKSGLNRHPALTAHRPVSFDTRELTAKEHALLNFLIAHTDEVCEKDTLIQAVWPEDEVYEEGIRDESLSQLVRRLRKKIEPDPSNPRYIHTVPGRGYRFEDGT
jgi:energy-coupling factor transporter ATP-binding protein EcfA2